MERIPAQLIYEIYKHLPLTDICIIECMSVKVQTKLRGTLSAMNYVLRKYNLNNVENLEAAKETIKNMEEYILFKFHPKSKVFSSYNVVAGTEVQMAIHGLKNFSEFSSWCFMRKTRFLITGGSYTDSGRGNV